MEKKLVQLSLNISSIIKETDMKPLHLRLLIPGMVLLLLFLNGCQNNQTSGAAAAVEAYLKALVGNDPSQISNLSCAAWESQGRLEFDSFAGVKASLKDASCKESGKDGNYTLVTCSGSIVANYNGEDQTLDLGRHTYQTVQEGGDWRMCGYR
jgi:hypothetical protein